MARVRQRGAPCLLPPSFKSKFPRSHALSNCFEQNLPDMNQPPSLSAKRPWLTPLLVTYDIADDRRRRRLHQLLQRFGEPLQKSVFVCWVDDQHHRQLDQQLEVFRSKPHEGVERIDCIVAISLAGNPPASRVIE